MRSEPGLFLSGRVMPAPGPARLRPFGCVAVVDENSKAPLISYVHDPEQEKLDMEASKR